MAKLITISSGDISYPEKGPWLHGKKFGSGRYKQAGINKINKLGKCQSMSVPKCQDVKPVTIG